MSSHLEVPDAISVAQSVSITATNPTQNDDSDDVDLDDVQTSHARHLARLHAEFGSTRKLAVPESESERPGLQIPRWSPPKTPMGWLKMVFPRLKNFENYDFKRSISKDIIAGGTVGIMTIPQSMSYAKLAGLPVEYGLYCAFIPAFMYALFGSSRQLAIGPTTNVSLLLGLGISSLLEGQGITPETHEEYTELFISIAIQTSLFVGVIYIALGVLRMGFVTNFLSNAVVSGFTTGAGTIIGLSQVKHIVGYSIPRANTVHMLLKGIILGLHDFNYRTFLVGFLSILALVAIKQIGSSVPKLKWVGPLGPLFVTVIASFAVWALGLDGPGEVSIVRTIPSGLPSLRLDAFTTPVQDFAGMTQLALSILVVGFTESIAVAKQIASKHKYDLDASNELIGLGMANCVGCLFSAYPVSGSFSRSNVMNETGAQSAVCGIVMASIVGFTLLFLTPLFERVPLAVLAAIVISVVLKLLNPSDALFLWKVNRFDFGVWLIACLATMLLGVRNGLVIAVGVSLLIVIYEASYPPTSVMGRLPGTTMYRNVKQYPETERYDGVVIFRVDAPLFFANTQHVREKLLKYERAAEREMAEAQSSLRQVRYIIWNLSSVPHIDTTALLILLDLCVTYKARGVRLCFSNPTLSVMESLESCGLEEKVGRKHIFVSTHDALTYCLERLDQRERISVQEMAEEVDVEQGMDDVEMYA